MVKPTWVFVSGTYRTASTTQYRICRDVVETAKLGKGIGYHTDSKLKDFDKPGNNDNAKFVVCKVFKFLPEINDDAKYFLEHNRLLATVTIRDPRDIITSMRAREEGRKQTGQGEKWDFEATVRDNFPIWLSDLTKWIDLGPRRCLVTRFEDMTQNLYHEVQRIARHLTAALTDEQMKTIAKQYTIQAQREAKREFLSQKKKDDKAREDPWLPSVPGICFGASGMHATWLTTSEKKLVEETCREFMERFGYL